MAIESSWVLLLGGFILASGFVVHSLFRRLGAPDILFLLFLGLLLGPVLGVLDRGLLLAVSPLVSAIALVVLLFEGGLSVRSTDVAQGGVRGSLLGVASVLLTAAAIAAATHLLFAWEPLFGLLFGFAVAPSGTVVLMSLLRHLPLRRDVAALLTFENAVDDVIGILLSLALLDFFLPGGASPSWVAAAVVAGFLVGAALGLAGGLLSLLLLERVRRQPYFYMLVLALAFILYSGAEIAQGSGPMAVLTFGLLLGNPNSVLRRFGRMVRVGEFQRAVGAYHAEITFLVRSFFFVYMGALVSVSQPGNFLYGGLLLLPFFGTRYLAVLLCTLRSSLAGQRALITLLSPKGLSTAAVVTAVLGFSAGNPAALPPAAVGRMVDLAFSILILSIVVATVGGYLLTRRGVPVAEESSPEVAAAEEETRRKMREAAFDWWRSGK
ncbi:MAG: cation:proton antiporter [Halobacteria archaeon]